MAIMRCLSILALIGWFWPFPLFAQTGAGAAGAPSRVAPESPTPSGNKPATKPTPAAQSAKPVHHASHQVAKPATSVPATPPVVSPPPPEDTKPEAKPAAPKIGSVTGLPVPRFAALRSDDVNLRVGPGTRYPIGWVYKRRDLPVQIEREYEVWRLVSDEDGNRGWVHQATLTGRRTFVVRDATRTLRHTPEPNAPAVAILKPGVVGRIINCGANSAWCELQVGEYRGYLKREEFWGVFPGEPVN
jgi:SH3-like domain-containing protein